MNRFIEGPPGIARPQPQPARTNQDHGREVADKDGWTPKMHELFKFWRPGAIVLVGSEGPVSVVVYEPDGMTVKRQFGHNRGVWPFKLVGPSAWADTATKQYNTNPFFFLGTQLRFWARSKIERKRAAEAMVDKVLAPRADRDGALLELYNDAFYDLGNELNLNSLKHEMREAATQAGVKVWDDVQLTAFLSRAEEIYYSVLQRGGRRNAMDEAIGRALGKVVA